MSQENIDAFRRAIHHLERRDVEAILEELDPEVEWHPAFSSLLGGEMSVYRGHKGAREVVQQIWDVFSEAHFDVSEIRDLGDKLLAIGTMRVRGAASGTETESPWAYVVRFEHRKAISIRVYTDPAEALEAAEVTS
jgi:ketosteroid isomerase-like protein